MKRALLMLVAIALTAGLAGCRSSQCGCLTGMVRGTCQDAPENCGGCGEDGMACGPAGCAPSGMMGKGGFRGGFCNTCRGIGCMMCRGQQMINPGPPTGTTTYPYYTTRASRDFLASQPRSIGP